MAQVIRQSTAVDVRLGPFVDVGDGFTPETGVTIAASDEAEILKHNGAATVAMAGTLAAVTNCDGWYDYTMSVTDTDTVGLLDVVMQDDSVYLPVHARFQVVEEAVYDELYTSNATAGSVALSDIESSLVIIKSDLVLATSDTAAIESELIVVHSETTVIQSDTTRIESDVIVLDDAISDVESSLVIVKSDLVLATSDTAAIESELIQVHSETTIIQSDVVVLDNAVSDVESSLVIVKSDLVVISSDTAAIEAAGGSLTAAQDSKLTRVQSDVVVLDAAVSDVESSLVIVKSDLVVVSSDTAAIEAAGGSLTAAQDSKLTRVQSDVVLLEAAVSDVESSLVIVKSDLVIIGSDTAAIESAGGSLTVAQDSKLTRVQSDVVLLEGAVSDVESSLVIVKSDLVISNSDTTAIESELIQVHSETTIIQSDVVELLDDVAGIGTGGSSALNFPVSADNTGGAIDPTSVTFVGSQTGTFSNTQGDLTTFHQITHSGNAIDLVYRMAVGATREATSLTIDGYLDGSNDELNIQVYDHVGNDWETLLVIDGQAGTATNEYSIPVFEKHTGAVGTAEAGNIYVRFVTTAQTAPELFIARALATAVVATSTMGYENGSVWVDEANGTSSGTSQGIDGTFANQSDDFDNAQTIADNLGTSLITIHPGNTVTLAAALQGYTINNVQATLNGGSQNIDSTRINGGFVTGTFARAGTGVPTFNICNVNGVTSDRVAMLGCGIVGTFTVSEAGLYAVVDCQAAGATGISTFDMGAAVGAGTLNFERWSGNVVISNIASGDVVNLHCSSGGDVTLNGADGTVNISGPVGSVTDNRTGSPTLNDDSVRSPADIRAEIDANSTTISDVESSLVIVKSDLVQIYSDTTVIASDVAGTVSADMVSISGSTTAADNLEASALGVVPTTVNDASATTTSFVITSAETTDDHFNGRIIVFTSGALAGQATDITDYVGSTRTVTVTALTEAPANGVSFVIV